MMQFRSGAIGALAVVAALALTGCSATARATGAGATAALRSAPPVGSSLGGTSCSTTVVAAGDFDSLAANRATGLLAKSLHPQVVAVLGDEEYPSLTYQQGYQPTAWAQLRGITRPVPGNHDYQRAAGRGYYTYLRPPASYYAYDLPCGWRAYALNSERGIAAEARWLRADLQAHPGVRVLAYWHKPRFSSGYHPGDHPETQPLWAALAGHTGIVLAGHEHQYERFAVRDGLREFVVGTAGASSFHFRPVPAPGSEKRIRGVPGVLDLQLSGSTYVWSFRDAHDTVLDSGTGRA